MSDLDLTEAVAAAIEAVGAKPGTTGGRYAIALKAAAPLIEAQVRERIAAEGQEHADKQATWIIVGAPAPELAYEAGWRDAFRFIARGGVS